MELSVKKDKTVNGNYRVYCGYIDSDQVLEFKHSIELESTQVRSWFEDNIIPAVSRGRHKVHDPMRSRDGKLQLNWLNSVEKAAAMSLIDQILKKLE